MRPGGRSLKKELARLAVGGRFTRTAAGNEVAALAGVNLGLGPGDRLGLVGHNGSGKTTLLRVLAGAYQPDQGQLEIRGRIAALLDLSLGMDPLATGRENLRLRALLAGLSGRETATLLSNAAALTGLGSYLELPVKTYSAGMQARLAFAAATALDADIVLMDEWIAVGDAEFQIRARSRLHEMVDRAGILVLATHDPHLLRTYCNKVLRLEGGRASEVIPIAQADALLAA